VIGVGGHIIGVTSHNSPSEVGPARALIDGSSIYDERNDGSSARLD
jgi:hypothetical protein